MRSVTLYVRKRTWYLCPKAFVPYGVGIRVRLGPEVVVRESISPSEKGAALLKAFALCKDEMPFDVAVREGLVPADLNYRHWQGKIMPALYALAGVRTWAAFVRGAVSCTINQDGGEIRIIPTRHEHGGFAWMHDDTVVVPDTAATEDIGAAVERAVAKCE
jgi:hypothetical protein